MVWITRDLEEISKVGVRDTGKTSESHLLVLAGPLRYEGSNELMVFGYCV